MKIEKKTIIIKKGDSRRDGALYAAWHLVFKANRYGTEAIALSKAGK